MTSTIEEAIQEYYNARTLITKAMKRLTYRLRKQQSDLALKKVTKRKKKEVEMQIMSFDYKKKRLYTTMRNMDTVLADILKGD